jgi:primosomal protein N' (replication factor Y)
VEARDQLFPLEPPASDAGEPRRFAEVVLNRPLDQTWTYAIPPALEDRLQPGQRVRVPLGRSNRPVIGYCVAVGEHRPARPVKPILELLDDTPLLTPPLIELTRWMAAYYLCPWGQILDGIVPAGAKKTARGRYRLVVQAVPQAELPIPPPRLTERQRRAWQALCDAHGPVDAKELAERLGCSLAVVEALVKKGVARGWQQEVELPRPLGNQEHPEPLPTLNADQQQVHAELSRAIDQGGFQPFLLHGVTGSGKTEVYLRAIAQCVAGGREALVLVPEISLTPQTIARFQGRFRRLAVLHSHLSEGERGAHWRRIVAGQVEVIVGARSAIFAPTRRLGLIIVDEEHETSFKQETTPRYHARDLAVLRARLEGIPVVLGSATPSLESWLNAQQGRYRLLSLPRRVLDRPMPSVHLVDLRHEPASPGPYQAISPSLERAMRQALDRGGQVILLLNRRGYATCLLCPRCGEVVRCRFCDVALTHHRDRNLLLCHYCGYEQEPPALCPHCGLRQIRFLGLGTQKLEAELAAKFPGVAAVRVDSDSMRRAGAHARAFEAFRRGEVRILFGTQMIAKGLDFPNVTLVGVILADLALHIPDFRSAERTFQLLAQVAGRTGRGAAGGSVIIQTFNPEQPCISLAARHDFPAFAEIELRYRRQLNYPPFARLVRIVVRGWEREPVRVAAERLAQAFRDCRDSLGLQASVDLLGPAEPPLARLHGYHRYHFQLRSRSSKHLHDLLRRVLPAARLRAEVELAVDVDPYHLL